MRVNNMCIFSGTAVRDMDRGITKNGKNYARFTIAVYMGKDRDSVFIPCLVFGPSVEWINVDKGDNVSVAGTLSTQKTDKTGEYGVEMTLFCDDVDNISKRIEKRLGIERNDADTSDIPF